MAGLLSSVSVLLVFLTFLFNSIEKEVTEKVLERKPEIAQKDKRKKFDSDVLKLLWLKTLPVTAIYIITFYSLLPRTIRILTNSRFSIWSFDELTTIFIFIEIGLLGLAIFAISKSWQLIKKYRE